MLLALSSCGAPDQSASIAAAPTAAAAAEATQALPPAPTDAPIEPTPLPTPSVLATTLVAPSATPPPVTPEPSATLAPEPQTVRTNRIAFTSSHEGTTELYLVNADGSQLTRLTDTAEDERYPAWSPDGQWIVFNVISQNGQQTDISKVRLDGGQLTRLTDGTTSDHMPAWSHDGQSIAFLSYAKSDPTSKESSPGRLYQMRADGSERIPLDPYDPATADTFLLASANGQYLLNALLFSTPQGDYNDLALRMNDSFRFGLVEWAPDRRRMVFVSSRDGNDEIYKVNADGSGRTRLTNDPAEDRFPAWSPDGQRIAFVSAMGDKGGVYVMDADGSHRTLLIADPAAINPTWSPDGKYLALNSNGDIVIVHADGGHSTTIYALQTTFAWAPR
jgi:TolB protein